MLLLRHDRSVVEIMASVITAVTLAGLRAVIIGLTSLAVPDNSNHPGSTANTFILTVPFVMFIPNFSASPAGAAILPCMLVTAATQAYASIQFDRISTLISA